jgi:hypothetical protein
MLYAGTAVGTTALGFVVAGGVSFETITGAFAAESAGYPNQVSPQPNSVQNSTQQHGCAAGHATPTADTSSTDAGLTARPPALDARPSQTAER